MARLYVFGAGDIEEGADEVKCPSCGWRTTKLYVLADSREEAEKMVKEEGIGMCGMCIAEMLNEDGYEVFGREDFKKPEFYGKIIDRGENEGKIYVPRVYRKEDIEKIVGRKLTDEEMKGFVSYLYGSEIPVDMLDSAIDDLVQNYFGKENEPKL